MDLNEARKYVGQGQLDHTQAVQESINGDDPIGDVWFFESYVRASNSIGGTGEFMRM